MNSIAQAALAKARLNACHAQAPRRTKKFWTPAEEDRLRKLYGDTPMPELIAELGRAESAIYGKAASLGLKRSEEYLASQHACRLRREDNPGLEHRFKVGQTPWNKGLAFDCGGRSAETRFAPGSIPHNNVPVGTERVTVSVNERCATTGHRTAAGSPSTP